MRPAVLVGVLAGCFDPRAPEGAPCGTLHACPSGQTCNLADDRCYAAPPGGSPDGSTRDAPTSMVCTPRRLLTGGQPVEAQGWTIERAGTGTVTYGNGVTTLTTSANARQLLVLRDAYPPDRWAIAIAGEVVQAGGHTDGNASIALMASFHDPAGDAADRARMVFLDEGAWGFGTGGTSIGTNLKVPATYRLERTPQGGIKASVMTSGTSSISTSGFTSNGSLAVGDQTTEPGLDSTFRIASIDLSCP